MHGLIIVCMIPGAMPFEKRTCMINADHVPTAHVKDGFSLDDLSSDTMISCCAYHSQTQGCTAVMMYDVRSRKVY